MGDSIGRRVPRLNLAVPQRSRESGRPGGTGLFAVAGRIPKEADALPAADHLLALHAPLIGRCDERAAGDDVIIPNVRAGSRAPGRFGAISWDKANRLA